MNKFILQTYCGLVEYIAHQVVRAEVVPPDEVVCTVLVVLVIVLVIIVFVVITGAAFALAFHPDPTSARKGFASVASFSINSRCAHQKIFCM